MRINDRGPPIELDPERLDGLALALDVESVVAAFVFGSVATGRATPLSDVDVGVWLDPALSPRQRLDAQLRLMAEATSVLGTDEVEVVILNDAAPLLQHRAMRARLSLVDRQPKARVRLEAGAQLRYLDTKPLRQAIARGVEERLREGRFGRS
ncbi:MAG: type VII toxin-antitoxin system MntA family adenylyltransferase antitoxin [Thermoleophilaceae bacterium]